MKTALITGITGQDGSYLAEFLLQKEYQVIGMIRENNGIGDDNIKKIKDKLVIEKGDLLNKESLLNIFKKHQIDEVYNLGGITFIPASWENPTKTFDVNTLGYTRLLEIIKNIYPKTRIFQANSAKIFGKPDKSPQDLNTKINPGDPYGTSKAAAHLLTDNMRKQFGIYAVSGIMYNHESERRGAKFVTRKITMGAVKIKKGMQKELKLGNLDAQVDWGYAPDFVKAMWLSLQQEEPDDYIFATGEVNKVKDICKIAFNYLDLEWQDYVKVDKQFYREQKGKLFTGDITKAKEKLGWEPETSFKQMIEKMVEFDLKNIN